jgi:anti-anti-sigma factor
MQHPNEVRLSELGAVAVLEILGDVTAASENAILNAYSEATSRHTGPFILRFDSNGYVNSGGIAVLIQLLAQARRNRQTIGITGLSDHFRKIFHMVGITKFATIYGTSEEAVAALTAGT